MARMFPQRSHQTHRGRVPHPLVQRVDLLKKVFTSNRAVGPFFSAQVPRFTEWRIQQPGWIEDYLGHRPTDGWTKTTDGKEAVQVFGDALRITNVGYCANEYLRWLGRSRFRADGFRYSQR
ncbi:MAG: hypothetical protein U1U88_001737 [Lawsonella clevelandensis]